jgi:hypothetical protein
MGSQKTLDGCPFWKAYTACTAYTAYTGCRACRVVQGL